MAKKGKKKTPKDEIDDLVSEIDQDLDDMIDENLDDLDDDDDGDDDDEDLEEMSKKELKKYIKDNELDVKVTSKMDADDIREAIEKAKDSDDDDDDDDGLDDLDDIDNDLGDDDDTVDFSDMDKKELVAFAKDNDLTLKKADKSLTEKKLRKKVEKLWEESQEANDDDDDNGDDDTETVDFDEMDKDELIAFADENDLTLKKADKKLPLKKLRKKIEKLYEESQEANDDDADDDDEDNGYDEVDLEELGKKQLLEFIDENDLTVKGAKGMKPKKLRLAIAAAMENGDDDDDGDDDDEVDFDEMKKPQLRAYAKEHGIKIPKGTGVKELRAMLKNPKKASSKTPKKTPKDGSSKGTVLAKGKVNKILKKFERMETIVEAIKETMEEDEPIKKLATLKKVSKKASMLASAASEIDDALTTAIDEAE